MAVQAYNIVQKGNKEPCTKYQEPASMNSLSQEVRLVCGKDGEIDAVRLFPSRAEVSRRLKFSAKAGRNNVIVSGLPRSLLTESVKYVVESIFPSL